MTYTSTPHVLVIETPGLGNRGYIAHDGAHAVVIDPQRDIDRVEHLVAEHGLTVTHVLETHVHNDYVTGGLELARRHGAVYAVPADAKVPFDHTPVSDGDTLTAGGLTVTVLATPGHTPHHVSYSVERSHAADAPPAVPDVGAHPGSVFTGGSLLYGAVGRPDLVSPDLTEGLAHDQWRSVQRLASDLSDETHLYPTHGFGSFCAATQNEGTAGTLGDERADESGARTRRAELCRRDAGRARCLPRVLRTHGPSECGWTRRASTSPFQTPADAAQLRARIDAGEWVIDLRSREVFAAGSPPWFACRSTSTARSSHTSGG